ncbi:ubiquitin c-terminal hydrolase [Grosmannia clavigera kw1407]|uniref:ubiquitinyl hydrolase 1 n=1 Tax=Grosmannia clavigera (strain kw1407 / UAMH 11150) TaxID=655863 RepID=F0XG90_GROCL|nr:ubiquitin c-terminal hydrolase [Grosmannia clavigera kw1407]EFX02723.1 ubiquitin c-terminal hydrolase [Grosmannia clavigera kw1407]
MKTSLPRKFMSLRDKNGTIHRRSKSSDPQTHKSRPHSADVFLSYFKSDAAKQAARAEEEKGKQAAKLDELRSRLDQLHFTDVAKEHLGYVLRSKYADGDVDKAVELIRLQRDAFAGVVLPYNPNSEMKGAENRFNVTCYLDALLFAMFAKLSAFECMLKNELPDGPPRKLAALIRLWVNMLRTGRLIYADMAAGLQETLADCGWSDARLAEQQDTSEAFAFITETLQLPLLTLQVDLFHQGKRDEDDHKVVYERLLNLAVPPDPDGKGIKLEDCLEDYFNTKVDVLRDSAIDKKSLDRSYTTPTSAVSPIESPEPSMFTAATPGPKAVSPVKDSMGIDTSEVVTVTATATSQEAAVSATATITAPFLGDTVRIVPSEDDAGSSQESAESVSEALDDDPAPLHRRWTTSEAFVAASLSDTASSSSADPRLPLIGRQRSASIIQRIALTEAKPANMDSSSIMQQFKRQGSTVIKAVTIPAWQIFRLIPWHAASDNEPVNDIEVARQFNKRPVVGICLKRYMMTNGGQFQRQNTYIDIPDSLRLPYFMMAADGCSDGLNDLNFEYKLVLQSVVCHRGVSLHSGHYISFARVNPKTLTDNRRHELDPPPDYEEEQWVKFDDLDVEHRVTYVEDIKAALKDEMPYLLFYQIMPMVDLTPTTTSNAENNRPPSYTDSTSNIGYARPERTLGDTDLEQSEVDLAESGTAAGASSLFSNPPTFVGSTTGPSIRFSSDLDAPPSISLYEGSNASSFVLTAARKSESISRRGSIVFADSISNTPAITPEGGRSPMVTPRATPEETPAQRFSRAAARLAAKSRSRPVSQAGEGRISLTMTRLGGLMRPSKEPLRQSEDNLDGGLGTSPLCSTANPSAIAASDSLLPPNPILANVVSAPAACPPGEQVATTLPTDSPSQGQPQKEAQLQADDGHHHHHHHGLRRGKPKLRVERESDEENTGTGAGKGKEAEKEKVRIRTKMNVPERECVVM